jgi:hypothetical protein
VTTVEICNACNAFRRVLRATPAAHAALVPITPATATRHVETLRTERARSTGSTVSFFVSVIAVAHAAKSSGALAQTLRESGIGNSAAKTMAAGAQVWRGALSTGFGIRPLLIGVSMLLRNKCELMEVLCMAGAGTFDKARVKAAVLYYHGFVALPPLSPRWRTWVQEDCPRTARGAWPRDAVVTVAQRLTTFPQGARKVNAAAYIKAIVNGVQR